MADRATLKLHHPEPEVRAAHEGRILAQDAPKPSLRRFSGDWLVYRKVPQGFRPGARHPRFRHKTFGSAKAEAERLLALHPESTFVLMQEQATVKAQEDRRDRSQQG